MCAVFLSSFFRYPIRGRRPRMSAWRSCVSLGVSVSCIALAYCHCVSLSLFARGRWHLIWGAVSSCSSLALPCRAAYLVSLLRLVPCRFASRPASCLGVPSVRLVYAAPRLVPASCLGVSSCVSSCVSFCVSSMRFCPCLSSCVSSLRPVFLTHSVRHPLAAFSLRRRFVLLSAHHMPLRCRS